MMSHDSSSASKQLPNALRNKRFACGDLITKSSPYAFVISMKHNGKYCDGCALPPKGAKHLKCSACQYEHYCNKTCQKNAWKYHKFECPLIQVRYPILPADSVRLFTKILWNVARGFERPMDDPGWRVWSDLCHHSNVLRADERRSREWIEVYSSVVKYVGADKMKKLGMPSSADALAEFGRMAFNGYTIDHLSMSIGCGVYVSPSVFNHSCSPNALHVTDGTTLHIRALRDIDTSKESIFVNYIDPMQPRQLRQDSLWTQYYFHCDCSKCSDIDKEALLESTVCPTCEGYVVNKEDKLVCTRCNQVHSKPDYIQSCQKAVLGANKLCDKNQTVDIAKLDEFISTNKFLSDQNVNLAMVKNTLYSYLSMGDNVEKAHQAGEELTNLLYLYYPKVYPVHGTHQLKQARLASNLGAFDVAVVHYRRCLESLVKSHGPDYPLINEIHSEMRDCERAQLFTKKQ